MSELDRGERRRKEIQNELREATNFVKNIRTPEIARFVETHWKRLGQGYEGLRLYSQKLIELDAGGNPEAANEFITKVKPLLSQYFQEDMTIHARLEKMLETRRPVPNKRPGKA